ncbi:MAG: RNase adapter RapZ [Lachnospiraceae bacterium]|nr:RNase adapter RapZ [Lachnospiraceae bacterium]
MKLIIVTGMSGAGKSTSLKMLEDMGYFCIDNLPVFLIEKFAELFAGRDDEFSKMAIGFDVRTGLKDVKNAIDSIKNNHIDFEILYLDASDDVIIKRFKETRRSHPLVQNGRVEDGIEQERQLLKYLKDNATYIIDTSQLLTRELKAELTDIFVKNKTFGNIFITILSFGYKYGIPHDADLVFDVRFLPNPYYIDELRPHTGNDKEVRDFLMGFPEADAFLLKLEDMLNFLIPNYITEGKNQLVVAIGCTGGKHRSVTLANSIYERLKKRDDLGIRIEHRDIEKDAKRGK